MFSGHLGPQRDLSEVPWHEFVEAAGEMAIGELGEDVDEVGLRIDAVELGGLDQRGDDAPVLAPSVGACEQGVLPIERDWPDGALDGIGGELDAAVLQGQ